MKEIAGVLLACSILAACGGSPAAPGKGDVPASGAVVNDVSLHAEALNLQDGVNGPFTLAGSIVGLASAGLVLTNGAEDIRVDPSAKTFAFNGKVPQGGAYQIRIKQQPSNQSQTCTVSSSTGVAMATVKNALVNCRSTERFGYGVSHDSNTVDQYSFDIATGGMSFVSSVPWATTDHNTLDLVSVVPHPYRPYIYVLSDQARNVYTFHVDDVTGSLSQVGAVAQVPGDTTFGSDGYETSLAFLPNGKYAYTVDSIYRLINIYAVDETTGHLSAFDQVRLTEGSTAERLSLDIDPEGKFIYVGNSESIFTYEALANGSQLQLVQTSPVTMTAQWLSVHPNGKLAYTAFGPDQKIQIFRIDEAGKFTMSGEIAELNFPERIKVDPTGKYVAVARSTGAPQKMVMYKITDLTTGALGAPNTGDLTGEASTLTFTRNGKYVFAPQHEVVSDFKGFAIGNDGMLTPTASAPAELKDRTPLGFTLY